MTKSDPASELSEAALALDHELLRFEELSAQASRMKLSTERSLEGAAAALMGRAQQIAARRAEFAEVLQRMGALGQMAKEVQELLKGPKPDFDQIQARMQKVADDAARIAAAAQEKEMEDLVRQAE